MRKTAVFFACFAGLGLLLPEIASAKSAILIMQLRPIGVNEAVSLKLSEHLNNAFTDVNSAPKDPFEVNVTNADLQKILGQKNFEIRFAYDEAINLGKQKGADFVLLGSVGKLHGRYIVNTRIVKVATGVVEWAEVKRLDVSTDDNGLSK